jgi:hypothetical protein
MTLELLTSCDRIPRNSPETPVQPLLLSTDFEEICNKYVCPRVIGGERLGGQPIVRLLPLRERVFSTTEDTEDTEEGRGCDAGSGCLS